MDNFQLSFLLKIIGLGSASGLLYHDKTILAIGDNSGFLTEYNIETKKITQHPIIENAKQNIEKKVKPDFESITQFENNIYIFGSGSTENRNKMVQVDAKSKKIIKTDDVTDLYFKKKNKKLSVNGLRHRVLRIIKKLFQLICLTSNCSMNK